MKRAVVLAIMLIISILWSKLELLVFPFVTLLFISMPVVFFYRNKIYDDFNKESQNILFSAYLLYAFSLMVLLLSGEGSGQMILISTFILIALMILLILRYYFKNKLHGKKEQERLIGSVYYHTNLMVVVLLVVNKVLFN